MKNKKIYIISILFVLIAIILLVFLSQNNILFKSSSSIIDYDSRKLPFTYDIVPDGTVYTWIEGQGSGTEDDPYLITNKSDFVKFINLNKQSTSIAKNLQGIYFEMTNDIEFDDSDSVIQLSTHSNYFYGHFDGKGHVVKNLKAKNTNTAAASLFGRVRGVVQNVGFVGGKFTVSVTSDMSAVVASRLEGSGVIYNVFSTTDLDFTTTNAASKPAGIVSYMENGSIINCYYGGNITAREDSNIYGITRYSAYKVSIINSFTGINVNANYNIGANSTAHTTSVFSNTGEKEFLEINTSSSLKKLNLYQFKIYGDYFYKLSDDGTYLTFTEEKSSIDDFFEGEGTKKYPFLISTNEDLILFRSFIDLDEQFIGCYFSQMNNLDFTNENEIVGLPYEKIFSGYYDGMGHYIKNLKVNGKGGSLFGGVVNGEIKNFGLRGGLLTANSGRYSGTITRRLENSKVSNVYSTMDVRVGKGMTTASTGLFGAIEYSSELSNVYYGGHVTYDSDADPSVAPFFSLFIIVNYSSTTRIPIENAFYPKEYNAFDYEAEYLASIGSTTRPLNSVVNLKKMTMEELKSETLLHELQDYVLDKAGLNYWELTDEYEFPYHTAVRPEDLNSYIYDLYVDGYSNDNEVSTDKIRWYIKNNEYYIFLPKDYDRSNLFIHFDIDDETVVTSNNIVINNDSYTDIFNPDKVILTSKAPGKASKEYKINVMQSDLPSLFISIDGGDEAYKQIINDKNHETGFPGSSITFDQNGNPNEYVIKEIKGRGNKTWTLSKRPYQVKFDSKVSMLGMKEAKTWLLLAGYTDGSLSRNYLAQTLSKELGVNYTIEFEPADVYINNEYKGSFLVTSKVERDPNRVDINKGEGEDKDFLVEIDNSVDDYQFTSSLGYVMTIKSPKLDDFEEAAAKSKMSEIEEIINNFESKLTDKNTTYEELSDIIDMESFAKFYWVEEFFENFDFMVGSSYFYYKNGKIHMGPVWDMDNSLNRSYIYANLNQYYSLTNTNLSGRRKADWYGKLLEMDEFSDLVDKMFVDNMNLFESLPSKLDEYNNRILSSANMNYVRWPYDEMKLEQASTWINNENSYSDAVNILRNNLITRYNWYKSQYKDVIYDSFRYQVSLRDGIKIGDTINLDEVNVLSVYTDVTAPITIYGTINGVEKEIYNGPLQNGPMIIPVEVTQSTGRTDKVYNSYTYDIMFDYGSSPVDIVIKENPIKTVYYVGEKFDPEGMVVALTYMDGTEKEIDNYTYSQDAFISKDNKITISFGNLFVDLPVKVITKIDEFELEEETAYIIIGDTYKIKTISPSGLELVYETNDSNISISSKGVITGLEIGDAKVNVYPKENDLLIRELTIHVESDKFISDNLEVNDLEDRIVIGSEPNTKILEFMNNLLNTNKYLKVYDFEDNLIEDISNEIIKTGYKVRLENNNNIFDEALIIIRGDIYSDGEVNISDSVTLGDHVLRKVEILDYRLYASELFMDEIINVSDNVKLGDYILRKITSLNK